MTKIKLGRYRHFKGNIYEVIAVAKHSETQEELVIYRDTENPEKIYARPIDMFLEKINRPEYNYKGPRFKYLG